MTRSGRAPRQPVRARAPRPVAVGLFVAAVVCAGAGLGSAWAEDGISPIVFPRQSSSIRFDHAHSEHRGLACERCHVGAAESARADDLLLPGEDACVECHAEAIDRSADPEECALCHVGDGEGAIAPPQRVPPRLRFSHAAHAGIGMGCGDCHVGLTEHDGPGPHVPDMRRCLECHGEREDASGACRTCHLVRPDGKLRSRFPEGWLNPPAWMGGMHHGLDWLTRHRWVAADQGTTCASCHTESECVDCHDGRVNPPRVHPNDWLTVHADMARRDEPECTSCHAPQTFCVECHGRLGISPVAAPNVRASARYHPPRDVWIDGPNLHGREARRSMTTCVSCHAERDCVSCHGVLGIGAGLSPHPPGFRARCGQLLAENDRACRACHGDLSEVEALCR